MDGWMGMWRLFCSGLLVGSLLLYCVDRGRQGHLHFLCSLGWGGWIAWLGLGLDEIRGDCRGEGRW